MEMITIEINGTNRDIYFEEAQNELLGEMIYLFKWTGDKTFLMSYDFERDRLVVQGPAPYEAMEFQELISQKVEHYFL
ncbi:hypothetical protein [Pedobacter sp. UBA4863]|uniref:hypothetical protein n=1 Tax=Pedobacter sp. UBA4863 TaxID=1947060 RepID=UPI0025E5157E|nr:hypothetical protein [Pedobacter sp. UBA4863]